MKTLKPTLLVFCLAAGLGCLAQNPGTLRLLIDPGHNFQFIVDRKFRMQQRQVELTPGPHTLSFWAPERRIVDTTVVVQEGITRDFVLHLPYSAEYVAYVKQRDAFKRERNLKRYIPLGVTVATGVWTLTRHARMKDAEDVLAQDEEAYRVSVVPAAISKLKDETIPQHNDDLVKARTMFTVGCGLTALAAGYTIWHWGRVRHQAPPPFEDKEKLRFEGMAFVPVPGHGFMGGLTLCIR